MYIYPLQKRAKLNAEKCRWLAVAVQGNFLANQAQELCSVVDIRRCDVYSRTRYSMRLGAIKEKYCCISLSRLGIISESRARLHCERRFYAIID